ncbi:MAG: SOS response-associated peptidase [Tannerella sp.]|jgi:putative SOS response-associated peptidase YedK|nr:SOS response-associated peptidase [Tannerella sp.]
MCFSLLTVPANTLCAKIHNGVKNPFRMPVILSKADETRWLNRDLTTSGIAAMLQPFASDAMDARVVGKDFAKCA